MKEMILYITINAFSFQPGLLILTIVMAMPESTSAGQGEHQFSPNQRRFLSCLLASSKKCHGVQVQIFASRYFEIFLNSKCCSNYAPVLFPEYNECKKPVISGETIYMCIGARSTPNQIFEVLWCILPCACTCSVSVRFHLDGMRCVAHFSQYNMRLTLTTIICIRGLPLDCYRRYN